LSLGVPGDFKHEKFQNAIKKMREAIPNDRMAIHIPKDIESWDLWEEEMKQWLDYRKYGMKCVGMDTIALLHYNKVNLSKVNADPRVVRKYYLGE